MGKEGDLWDDSALINAFDNAISSYKVPSLLNLTFSQLIFPFNFTLFHPFLQKMHITSKNKQEPEGIIEENAEISTTTR
jgi:hypothetical protein